MTAGITEGRSIRPVRKQAEVQMRGQDADEAEEVDEEDEDEHMDDREEIEVDDTAEPPAKVMRDPGRPTAEEVERHSATHMPCGVQSASKRRGKRLITEEGKVKREKSQL